MRLTHHVNQLGSPLLNRRDAVLLGGLALAAIAMSGRARADDTRASTKLPRCLLIWGKQGSAQGEFHSSIGIAISKADEIFVTEFTNNRVQKFSTDGKFVAAFPVSEMPAAIAVDKTGHL